MAPHQYQGTQHVRAYTTAIRLGTAGTETILRRFAGSNVQHPTYRALHELGKACRTRFLCDYLTNIELAARSTKVSTSSRTGTPPTIGVGGGPRARVGHGPVRAFVGVLADADRWPDDRRVEIGGSLPSSGDGLARGRGSRRRGRTS